MSGHAHINAFKILGDVREAIGEYSTALWQGSDWSGRYSNSFLYEKINLAQSQMYALVMKSDAREIFYESASATVTSSVITLPSDFGRILQLEDADGYKVWPSTAKILPVQGEEGNDNMYYRDGNTLVLNKSGVSATYTLKYFRKPRDITWGQAASSSGALSLYMEDSDFTMRTNDYYNYFTIDNYTQGLSTTISDFVASTRVATTAAITWAAKDYYGTVPEFPSEFHHLIAPYAALLARSGNPLEIAQPRREDYAAWGEMFLNVLVGFINQPDDVSMESIFCDFASGPVSGGVNIPGQGYIVY